MKLQEKTVIVKKRAFFESELKKMAEDKDISGNAKSHMRHKPYVCDFRRYKND